MTPSESLMISREPECFAAGFKAAFSKYNNKPPVIEPCHWFRGDMIAAWKVGNRYGKICAAAIAEEHAIGIHRAREAEKVLGS